MRGRVNGCITGLWGCFSKVCAQVGIEMFDHTSLRTTIMSGSQHNSRRRHENGLAAKASVYAQSEFRLTKTIPQLLMSRAHVLEILPFTLRERTVAGEVQCVVGKFPHAI